MLGANPLASNGSLMTAPDFRGRLRRCASAAASSSSSTRAARRTAEDADEHVFIRPGTDALLLFGARARAVRRGPRRPRPTAPSSSTGLDEVRGARAPLHARRRSRAALRDRGRRRSAGSRASWPPPSAPRSTAASARCTQEFGTLASWLVDVLNVAHRQPRPRRAARCSRAAAAAPRTRPAARPGRGVTLGRWASRVRGLPEVVRRAAGRRASPRRSRRPARARSARWSRSPATRCCRRPNGARLDARARVARLHGQRRHLRQRDHPPRRRDPARRRRRSSSRTTTLALYQLAVRNVANYSPPVLDARRDEPPRSGRRCCA